MTEASHVRRAAEVCAEFLGTTIDSDWEAPVPDLEWTVADVVAHAAAGCLWYAIDLAAHGADLQTVEHRVKTDESKAGLIDTVRTYAEVVAAVIEVTPEATRGFHPMGAADPSGFAAMACDELLIHTDDAARGLGVTFRPPADLALAVLRRLFPWVDPGDEPWDQLRWANGRTALGERARLEGWAWHCKPIDEWSGTIPTWPPSSENS